MARMSTSSFNQLTCFIAAEHSPERSLLRKRLEDKQVTCFSIDRISASTVSVQSLIERSDFVAGIFPATSSQKAAFELGIALGFGKPLLLFEHAGAPVPFDLRSVNILQVDRLDQTAWNNYIEAFLRTIHPSKNYLRKSRGTKEEGRRLREIKTDLTRLLKKADDSFARHFERLVERAFKQGGFSVTSSPESDFGADFAIASPKLIEALISQFLSKLRLVCVINGTDRQLEDCFARRECREGRSDRLLHYRNVLRLRNTFYNWGVFA